MLLGGDARYRHKGDGTIARRFISGLQIWKAGMVTYRTDIVCSCRRPGLGLTGDGR